MIQGAGHYPYLIHDYASFATPGASNELCDPSAATQTYVASDLPRRIPDLGTVCTDIEVSVVPFGNRVTGVNVTVALHHNDTNDLALTLASPTTKIELMPSEIGRDIDAMPGYPIVFGAGGASLTYDNLKATVDSSGIGWILCGRSCLFTPEGLANLNGNSAAGTCEVCAEDDKQRAAGELHAVELELKTAKQTAIVHCRQLARAEHSHGQEMPRVRLGQP